MATKIYIPQKIDPFNTHLKNLVEAYKTLQVDILVGYENFLDATFIPDVIHFHMLEGLLSFLKYDNKLFFKQLDFFQSKGVRFIQTAHNVLPHISIKQLNFEEVYRRYLHYIFMVVHHGSASKEILITKFPELSQKKHIVCHHGDYLSDMKQFNENYFQARVKLALPQERKIILVFGQLQYKNTSFAMDVFTNIRSKHPEAFLILAGVNPVFRFNKLNKIYYKINNTVFNRFRKDRLHLHQRFSQYETYLLFKAADVIFLPHNSGLTSGIIPLSATLGKPFIYPRIGVFEEQAENCLSEKYDPGNIVSASDALNKIIHADIHDFDNSEWMLNNNWGVHAKKILSNL